MILPTEPIRGKTFEEYCKAAWEPEDDGSISFMIEMTCLFAKRTPEQLKAMANIFQVYWFEKTRAIMLEALKLGDEDGS